MKAAIIISIITLFCNCFQQREVYKDYRGGRKGFSYVRLTLYIDSTYTFLERFDFPGISRDSGNWKITKNNLVLTSIVKSDKLFENDSFLLKKDELLLFINEEDSTYNKLYRTLKEVNNNSSSSEPTDFEGK